ncbi:hypothetical protein HDV01_007475 [Terramyces sp. JEL0728]|nr:hypothetical protein HDV01_007475 [Terramyces sp. JEL0728]
MVKVYQRYKLQKSFGVIASSSSNAIFNHDGTSCYAPTLENITMWNLKQGTVIKQLQDSNSQTTFADGSIRIWDNGVVTVFNGHRAPVTCLAFDSKGARLVSGSADTDVILWDVVAEIGLNRFKGHKDQVTCVAFIEEQSPNSTTRLNHIVSGSKDTLVKVWDITAECCVENIVSHRGEVWALDIRGTMLLTGAGDGQLRLWEINLENLANKLIDNAQQDAAEIAKSIELIGNIEKQSKERVMSIKFHSDEFFGVQGNDKLIEIFKIRNDQELKKRLARKKKRSKDDMEIELELSDKISIFNTIKTFSKLRSFDMVKGAHKNQLRVLAHHTSNSLEFYQLSLDEKEPAKQISSIDLPGHRTDIRTLCLSEDDELLASGSSDMVKLWSTKNGNCVQTLESGYALCSAFVPGGKHLIVGTKQGELLLYELSSSSLLETIQAHEGPIWGIQILPDKQGMVTASQDKTVKFFKFGLIEDENYSKIAKRATAVHFRTLKLTDDVLSVRVSPDGKLLAVALLDLTVKIFYVDTLKFFLSLYGHKLPVNSMDISSDSRIIITASSDKTVKIWGLDFGDCHKSLLAHQDSVMQCQFVWGTYYFFTASKDKTIKYWDAEKFEEISKLEGHFGDVWALAVGKYGNFVASASHDKSIRIWEKTDDQFVLEEEREARLEEIYNDLDIQEEKYTQDIGSGVEGYEEKEGKQVEPATKSTMESLKAGELLSEALIIWQKENEDFEKYQMMVKSNPDVAKPARHPIVISTGLQEKSPEEYILHVVNAIRPSHLNDALLTLPFHQVITLLECVAKLIEKQLDPLQTQKILIFLLKEHHNEITSTRSLKPVIEKIQTLSRKQLKKERDVIGYNVYALGILLREKKQGKESFFGEQVVEERGEKRKRIAVK